MARGARANARRARGDIGKDEGPVRGIANEAQSGGLRGAHFALRLGRVWQCRGARACACRLLGIQTRRNGKYSVAERHGQGPAEPTDGILCGNTHGNSLIPASSGRESCFLQRHSKCRQRSLRPGSLAFVCYMAKVTRGGGRECGGRYHASRLFRNRINGEGTARIHAGFPSFRMAS